MRITRNLLIETARNHVKIHTDNNPEVACVFMVGSLTGDDPFVGGTSDVDLVFVHNTEPTTTREVIPVADEFHLDILHYPRRIFNQPKELRTDPWIGCLFCEKPYVLYDSYHFYDFIRAGIFSKFFAPANIFARSQHFYHLARRNWADLQNQSGYDSLNSLNLYLQSLWNAGNTIASLVGKPLPERRFLTKLEDTTTYLGRPGLASGMRDLYGLEDYSLLDWDELVDHFTTAFKTLMEKSYCPPEYSKPRYQYFKSAILTYKDERPDEALWTFLWAWINILNTLHDKELRTQTREYLDQKLHLHPDTFPERLANLDAYLDAVDQTGEDWKQVSGLY